MMPAYYKDNSRFLIAVDCIILGFRAKELFLLLTRRPVEPLKNEWSLMGGFMEEQESLHQAAEKILYRYTALGNIYMEQVGAYGELHRDSGGRVISVAYYALVNIRDHDVRAATDARNAAWFAVVDLPRLAFDHDEIMQAALERLRGKLAYQPVGFELLPELFTLSQLQRLYETILERPLDKRNFRRKIMAMDLVEETPEIEQDVSHRAARLFRFDKAKYQRLSRQGFLFEL